MNCTRVNIINDKERRLNTIIIIISVSNLFAVMVHVTGSGGAGLPEAAIYGGHV